MSIRSRAKKIVSKVKQKVKRTAYNLKTGAQVVGGAIKKAATTVKGTFGKRGKQPALVGYVGEGMTPAQTKKAYQTLSRYTGGTIGGKNVQSPTRPVSFSAGTRPATRSVTGPATRQITSVASSVPDYEGESYQPDEGTDLGSAPTNFTVGSDTIGTGNPLGMISSTPAPTNYQGVATGYNVGLGANPETNLFDPLTGEKLETPEEKRAQDYQEYIESKKKVDYEKQYRRAERESGIEQARQQKLNTQNQINAITAKMNTDLLNLRGVAAQEGVVEAVYGGQQAQVTREATIRLLPLQAQLAVDQDNLQMAESIFNDLYSIYSKEAEQSVKRYNDNVDAIWEFTTGEEKAKLSAILGTMKEGKARMEQIMSYKHTAMLDAAKDKNIVLYNALKKVIPPTNATSKTFGQDVEKFYQEVMDTIARYGTQPKTEKPSAVTSDAINWLYRNSDNADEDIKKFNTDPAFRAWVLRQRELEKSGGSRSSSENSDLDFEIL